MWEAATVYIVDDDKGVRSSLECLMRSVSLNARSYGSADEFLQEWDPRSPGCLILDLRMPGMSGLQLQEKLVELKNRLPIIFVSAHADVPTAVRAMRHGAQEFLTKPFCEEELLETVQRAIRQDLERRQNWQHQQVLQARWNVLTPREQQVFEGVVAGKPNKQVARDLGISPKTVELHRSNLMAKMHAESLPDLVQKYIELTQHWEEIGYERPGVVAATVK